jgi:ABC-type glycerol-3-phosphate transport system substrate-binding protein
MRNTPMKALTHTRRQWLFTAAALILSAGAAQAAPPVVEIVAFAHPPVQSALKPLRDWLAKQGGKLKVVEIDMETPEGEKRLQAVGVKGHVPIVVLIDGQYRHKRADGSTVEFVSFPAGPGTMPGTKIAWSSADVESVLKTRPQ